MKRTVGGVKCTPLIFAVLVCSVAGLSPVPLAAQKTLGTGEADKATGVYDLARHATVQVLYRTSKTDFPKALGSGVWISQKGYIATCYHVVAGAPNGTEIVIRLAAPYYETPALVVSGGGFIFHADVLTTDRNADVAILKTDGVFGKQMPFITVPGKPNTNIRPPL